MNRALGLAAVLAACTPSLEPESLRAHDIVEAVRAQTPMIDDGAVLGFESRGGALHARSVAGAAARVALPLRANQSFRLTDAGSGMWVEVTQPAVADTAALVTGGLVVYPDAFASGGHVIHRVHAAGTEDFLWLTAPPPATALSYHLDLGPDVAGVRAVAGTLELLDRSGTPRLRVARPYARDATGSVVAASLDLAGCAADDDPRAPWGRPVVPPGARRCELRLRWSAARYPLLIDPSWSTTGGMAIERNSHALVTLPNGQALVVAGASDEWGQLDTAELYDPETATWAATGSLNAGRSLHTATVLEDGRVLAVAGIDFTGADTPLTSCELYSLVSGTWSSTGALAAARGLHTATRLLDGTVLVTGGWRSVFNPVTPLSSAERFDPGGAIWSPAGTLGEARGRHAAALLADGDVLITGGGNLATPLGSAERYSATGNTWSSAGAMAVARLDATATALANGRVLVAGGSPASGAYPVGTEVFDPDFGWAAGGDLAQARTYHTTLALTDGSVVTLGGESWDGTTLTYLATSELYTTAWAATSTLTAPRHHHAATLLTNGRILVAGGYDDSYTNVATAEVYAPDTTACGDTIVLEPFELCDSGNLAGHTCAEFGFGPGTIRCHAHCGLDFSACGIGTDDGAPYDGGGGDPLSGDPSPGDPSPGDPAGGQGDARVGDGAGDEDHGDAPRVGDTDCTSVALNTFPLEAVTISNELKVTDDCKGDVRLSIGSTTTPVSPADDLCRRGLEISVDTQFCVWAGCRSRCGVFSVSGANECTATPVCSTPPVATCDTSLTCCTSRLEYNAGYGVGIAWERPFNKRILGLVIAGDLSAELLFTANGHVTLGLEKGTGCVCPERRSLAGTVVGQGEGTFELTFRLGGTDVGTQLTADACVAAGVEAISCSAFDPSLHGGVEATVNLPSLKVGWFNVVFESIHWQAGSGCAAP